jgi:hypothetical protein
MSAAALHSMLIGASDDRHASTFRGFLWCVQPAGLLLLLSQARFVMNEAPTLHKTQQCTMLVHPPSDT